MTQIDASAIFSGAPVSVQYAGVDCGATKTVPKYTLEVEQGGPDFTNAGGEVKGTIRKRKIRPFIEIEIDEITATKLAWAMPGCSAVSSASLGVVVAGLSTTLSADPAINATTIGLTSVTTVNAGDFIKIAPASNETEANSEVVRVVTKGTAGATDTVIENDAGGGLRIDHANAETVKTVTGTILSAPAAAGATNIKVDSVTGLSTDNFIRIGYAGHYETRKITNVGTVGPSGTGVTFAVPLTLDHSLDEWVIKVSAQGGTTIRPTLGLVPESAYQDLVLVDVGADGTTLTLTLENAMSNESQEMDFDDDPKNPLGLKLKFQGYYDEATPTQVPVTIVLA